MLLEDRAAVPEYDDVSSIDSEEMRKNPAKGGEKDDNANKPTKDQDDNADKLVQGQDDNAIEPVKGQDNADEPVKGQDGNADELVQGQDDIADEPVKGQDDNADEPTQGQDNKGDKPVKGQDKAQVQEYAEYALSLVKKWGYRVKRRRAREAEKDHQNDTKADAANKKAKIDNKNASKVVAKEDNADKMDRPAKGVNEANKQAHDQADETQDEGEKTQDEVELTRDE